MNIKLRICSVITFLLASVCYGSIEQPITREEFERKVEQQQAKIEELEKTVSEQKKQILDLEWKIYHLKYGADQNESEQSKDKVTENKKLQTIVENQKTEITELRAKLKRVTSKLQQATAKVAPSKAKGTKKTKSERFNVANGNEEITEVRKPAKRVLKRININKTGKGAPIFQKGIDEKYIRIGPGMEYENDDTGALFEDKKLHVLEEKNGWIRFRITEKDHGWSAWIRKNLTDSFSLSPEKERAERIVKLPENGKVTRYHTSKAVAPFEIRTQSGKGHYFVKLVDWSTKRTALTVFVRSGQTANNIDVPLGSYKLKYAVGKIWYGVERLFGPDTIYNKGDRILVFRQKGNQLFGHSIELILQAGGNFPTKKIPRSDF